MDPNEQSNSQPMVGGGGPIISPDASAAPAQASPAQPQQPMVQPNPTTEQPSYVSQPTPVTTPDIVPQAQQQDVQANPQPAVQQLAAAQPVEQQSAYAQPVQPTYDTQPMSQAAATPATTDENPVKHYMVALALGYFLGQFGADRFYLKRNGTAVAKLLTFGGFGIWSLIDLVRVAFGSLKASDDPRQLQGFAENSHWAKIVSIILVVINFGVFVLLGFMFMAAAVFNTQQESKFDDFSAPLDSKNIITESDTQVFEN